MLCHHYKCIFIHIPKNAGQSIEHVFLDLLDLTWETRAPLLLRPTVPGELGPPRLAHLKAQEYIQYKYVTPEMFAEYFTFSVVRNPWSRMVSFYKYLGFNKSLEFNQFLATAFNETVLRNKAWFVRPQAEFIVDDQDNLLVDFVGKFETLQNDFNYICQTINLPETTLPHVNKGSSARQEPPRFEINLKSLRRLKKQVMNVAPNQGAKDIPTYQRYQDYYNQESIDIVANLYSRDIELFKYDFD